MVYLSVTAGNDKGVGVEDHIRRCQHCGAFFTSPRRSARFCSARCRIGNHRNGSRPLSSVWLRRAARVLAGELLVPLGAEVAVNRLDIHFSEYREKSDSGVELGVIGGKAYGGQDAITIAISADAVLVLGTLLHELIHLATPGEGHGGRFAEVARELGFLPPVTQYKPSATLKDRLKALAQKLGPMPMPFDPRVSKTGTIRFKALKGRPDVFVPVGTPDWVPKRKP